MRTRVTEMFGIRYPVIQGGMVWVAGWRLAAAVSEAGGLGLIGSGSMKADVLREHIRNAHQATRMPFGVNVPLLREDAEELLLTALEEGITIFFTSAGNPEKFTKPLLDKHCTVVHVVSSVRQAIKAYMAGCHAVVGEGVEAGGHNGPAEISTMCLIPQLVDAVPIPVIAAGGIADGRGLAAALALGAEAVQVGTRFITAVESSAHDTFKRLVLEAADDGTVLTFRALAPVRLLRTPFARRVIEAEQRGATVDELRRLLGRKREMRGMSEGDVEEGQFEAGQCAALVKDIAPASAIIERMITGCHNAIMRVARFTDS
ncbi:MAG: nitronate monooxygenase [Bacteroidota bacterium]|nr:nitronate monooxygenase [Bacteroidota bacterium]